MKKSAEQHDKRVGEIVTTLRRPCASKMGDIEFAVRWVIILTGTILGLWTYFYN